MEHNKGAISMKKSIATALLTFMLVGLIGNGLIMWKEIAQAQVSIETLEKDSVITNKKIDDIHWYLIESKDIKIPARGKR